MSARSALYHAMLLTVSGLMGCGHLSALSPRPTAATPPPIGPGRHDSTLLSPQPVTAPAASPLFVNMSQRAGLHYHWMIAGKRPLNILQSIGNGCAFLDYNNDGNLDILLVG